MPLSQRMFPSITVPAVAYDGVAADQRLDAVVAHQLVGLLQHVQALSVFATDIAGALYRDTRNTGTHIGALTDRVHSIESAALPAIDAAFATAPAASFYQRTPSAATASWRNAPRLTQSLFDPQTQPAPMAQARAAAQSMPQLSLMDPLWAQLLAAKAKANANANANAVPRGEPNAPHPNPHAAAAAAGAHSGSDGDVSDKEFGPAHSCAKEFSNPNLFFDLWVAHERERVLARAAERKPKKPRRRDGQAMTGVSAGRSAKVVAQVQVKAYSAAGAEFAATAPLQTAALHLASATLTPSHTAAPSAPTVAPPVATTTTTRAASSAPPLPPPRPSVVLSPLLPTRLPAPASAAAPASASAAPAPVLVVAEQPAPSALPPVCATVVVPTADPTPSAISPPAPIAPVAPVAPAPSPFDEYVSPVPVRAPGDDGLDTDRSVAVPIAPIAPADVPVAPLAPAAPADPPSADATAGSDFLASIRRPHSLRPPTARIDARPTAGVARAAAGAAAGDAHGSLMAAIRGAQKLQPAAARLPRGRPAAARGANGIGGVLGAAAARGDIMTMLEHIRGVVAPDSDDEFESDADD